MSLFEEFISQLSSSDPVSDVRSGIIGHDLTINGPDGPKRMIYADYVASGRALWQIEEFVVSRLLPVYANSHTEASFVGATMTNLRNEARDVIRSCCHATEEHAVIFAGSGATQGLNRLVHLFDIPGMVQTGQLPVVLLGPYEHHSNILPWRESGAEVIELAEAPTGGPCQTDLARVLSATTGRPVIASLSAASNVTGLVTDVETVTRQLKAAGAKVIWDYAGGGPYLPIDLTPAADAAIDAVILSPHKFVGGPQASGLLVVRRDAVHTAVPTLPGGGTVRFVSTTHHDYTDNLEAREEAGTPNVIGDLRAALCLLVKQCIGQSFINARNADLCNRAVAAWGSDPNIEVLAPVGHGRLPIFSFRIRDSAGGYLHQQLVTRMLSDFYGIQARGGCACAGPYVHRLLDIDDATSDALRNDILSGCEVKKPGFTRLNLSYLASDDEVDTILNAVSHLAATATDKAMAYVCDESTAIFRPAAHVHPSTPSTSLVWNTVRAPEAARASPQAV